MEITTRTIGKCKILDCNRFNIFTDSVPLREAIHEAVLDDTSKVILNLGKVNYLDSAVLGAIISSYEHLKNKGGKLVLLNLNPQARELLAITRLTAFFEIFDDEKKALESCE